jgi:hypothetical protein
LSKTISFWEKFRLSSTFVLEYEFLEDNFEEKPKIFMIYGSDSSSFSKMGDNSLPFGEDSSTCSKPGGRVSPLLQRNCFSDSIGEDSR